ncbi:methyltransferase [Gemella sp. oral taxon 928]|uniref:class I SAM-dependent methyltransferase n=1 Tax=Gemella sp. oral taxon 928 TaxID=1785995 RepID=UPI00076800B1|nr:SAM-dependent methyltransferase [Gemella sp. oral taxon 928]AME09300.1 methyltransferase [Gemella sp. oral taxon 928]
MCNELINNLPNQITNHNIVKITFSNIRNKDLELDKVIAKLVEIKNDIYIQFEYRYKRVIKHKNIDIANKIDLNKILEELFSLAKDINVISGDEIINIKISKKFKISIKRTKTTKKEITFNHNNKKEYFLDEKTTYPFLVELGIQNLDGRIKKSKFNKFKQINKYLEFIKHSVDQLDNKNQITILDFGSGKSYLTFSTYYYLTEKLNLNVKLIGIDLKKEAINLCNQIAQKLNFNNLSFVYGDVIDYENEENIDMVISLHACNTATDIAIIKALTWQAKIFLAVPCCQKEINSQLTTDFIPLMLKHGIIKEKFSTLLTDSIRSEALEIFGYKSDIVEFISEENTPKNQLIRAFKTTNNIDIKKLQELKKFTEMLNIKMFLLDEIEKLM